MNDRQRAFAEYYAANPNAAEAARAAGYSEKTARAQGQRLLTNVDVQSHIKEIQDQLANARISSMTQVKAFWSDTMNNPEEKTADRLKASELFAKSAGAFIQYRIRGHEDEIIVAAEIDNRDVVIYLPEIDDPEKHTVKAQESEDAKG